MKAIVTRRTGTPPEMTVEERPVPARSPGHTLVRMHSATINQLANSLRTGGFGSPPLPIVLGNEGAGTVEESDTLPAGFRVAVYGHGDIGVTTDGLYQQYVAVPDHRLLPLPATLDWAEGAALTVNYLTAYFALTRTGDVLSGQTILISGATGGVGGALVQTGKALGAHPIAVVSTPHKAQRATEAGAEAVIDLSTRDLHQAVAELTEGQGADLALDPVGGPRLGELLRCVRNGGTVVSLGFAGGKQTDIDVVDLLIGEKHLTAYALHNATEDIATQGLAEIGELAAAGKLRPAIDSTYGLGDFEDAFARLTSRQATGAVVIEL
ncbi:zinc-binding alcohol dehydrogenase family protein [Streptomyces sp. NPDC002328]|uniref:quinone oxidoreductase family protein n=1 Tax=Streptomyces sp. NPDC002328 TaxID=3364642 RepID=UPI00369B8186